MAKKSSALTQASALALTIELARVAKSLDAVQASNQRIEDLLRVLAQPGLLSALPDIFRDARHLHAYHLSDGRRSTREIGKIVGVDQKTISRWWRAWKKDQRIIEKAGKRGQFRARYSLAELIARQTGPQAGEDGAPTTENEAEQAPLF